ncbi:serine/threonine protein kinase [Selenihalanaerobacter shriftii]|uniref:Protein kinase domain-containing protein n=1 Tax=Selenihalanaerobacter shriftii TaxID=142842 RepID=A0A1T4Q259_9FIRM|nr:serine/threonine-protein kinase [Selenihalanaerobacter shriftii]SJZ97581.1 Protein kinase domain-containing protein [Selenihalanaerobacter shriftii]
MEEAYNLHVENEQIDYIYLPETTILNEKYAIVEKLTERSNLSIVYLAINIQTKQRVVVKEFFSANLVLRDLDGINIVCKNSLHKDKLENEKESFLNEAKVMQKLQNKNIAKCYDYFKENNTVYIVMKYYPGETLTDYLRKNDDISINEFLEDVYFSLLNAIHSIHKEGYIHRDIKPDNIIINQNKPILIDFGSTINYKKEDHDKIILTPGFSPIEFYSTKTKQGIYSDIYSLSAILYYFCTKTIPDEVIDRIIEDNLISVNHLNNQISDYLNDFIMRNLSLDYNKRDKSLHFFKLKLWKEYLKFKFKKIIM